MSIGLELIACLLRDSLNNSTAKRVIPDNAKTRVCFRAFKGKASRTAKYLLNTILSEMISSEHVSCTS